MKNFSYWQLLIVVFTIAFLVGSNIDAQNKKSREILLNAKGDSHIVSKYQSDNIQTLYYDQTAGTVAGTGPNSQDFETAYDPYDNQAADNFTVTGGPWTINQVVVGGAYFNGAGPAISFNVYFYTDAGGVPGALVASATAQPYSYDGSAYFTISVSPAAVLANGNYWVSVQCRMDFGVGGQWAWTVVSGSYGFVAQWQNPGGGFGVCPTWGPITTCNTTVQTDLSFALYNIVGPGPATNPNPANGATGVPTTGLILSWTNPGGITQNAVYFGTSPGSLALLYSGAPVSSYPAPSPLSTSTPYYWRIDETDGSGTTTGSVWTFTTGCGTISTPFTENFESGAFPPACWSLAGPTTSLWGSSVSVNTGISGYGFGLYSAWANFYGVSSGTRDLVSPDYNASGLTSPELKFDWAYATYSGEVDELDIYYSTNSGSTWTLLLAMPGGTTGILNPHNYVYTSSYGSASQPVLPGDWSTETLSLPSGTNKVKFTAISAFGNNLFVDNITIDNVSGCPAPFGLTATGITSTTANIGWNGASTVDIDYGTPGHPAGSGTIVSSVVTNPYTLTGLTAATPYDVYVRQNCGGGSFSSWTGPLSFTTACDVVLAPWTQDFESGLFPPNCWSLAGPTTTLWKSSALLNSGISGYGVGAYSAWADFWGVSTGTRDLVSLDFNASGLINPSVKFDWAYDDYFGTNDELQISYSTDGGTTWVVLATGSGAYPTFGDFDLRTAANGIYNSYGSSSNPVLATDWGTISFNVPTNANKVKFTAITAYGNNLFVDNIKVVQPLANDVGTFSVDMAANYSAGTISPKATVKNFGTATNTFNVNMTIGAYSSTKTVTSLAPGATQQVTFDNWNATAGTYTVNVCTQLGSDGDPSNDCKSMDVGVYTGSWSSGVHDPDPRYLGGSVGYTTTVQDVTLNYLFTIGGGDTLTYIAVDKVNRYDVGTDTWLSRAPLPAARDRFCAVLLGDFIYAIGGADPTNVYQSTVYKYDIAGDSWTTVASLPSAVGWGKAVGYNNRIYFAGGFDGTNALSSVLVYDPVANTWTAATSMPSGRFGGAFSIVGNQLIYVGGADLSLIYNTVFVGTISGGDPLSISWTTAESPYPGLEKSIPISTLKDFAGIFSKPTRDKNINSGENAAYPPGTMFRFEGSPWGTDAIIVAGGSPSATWVPAVPSPVYLYKPGTDTWIKSWEIPIPVTAPFSGTVNDGNTWKLVISGGINNSGAMEYATQIWTDNLGGVTTFQLTVNVNGGWNMVSVPGTNPDGMGVNTWWPYRDMGANVFKYSGGYQSVTTTTPGIGYWMKHTGPRTYNTGEEWPAGGILIVPHNPIAGASGWNLFGGYELSVSTSGLTTNPPGLITGSVYKYSGGYQTAATLDPGYGYWVKLTGAGQIIIPETLAKGEAKEFFPEDWGKIIITDATGAANTLYIVKGKVNLDQYELPPAPPAGMVDVRFGSGRIAEDLNNGNQSIELNGLTYPVTIQVENMNVTLQDMTGKEINAVLKSGENLVINNSGINKLTVLSGELLPPIEYSLEQNYPNPFNPSTTIKFSLPETANVKLAVYNALGQKVAELVNSNLETGRYSYVWDAGNVASGIYFYELKTDNFVSIKKMVLLK